MIGSFAGIIYLGHFALTVMVMLLQLKFFHEIVMIGHVQYAELKLPWFRSLNWYFLVVSNYFLFGEEFADLFLEYFLRTNQPMLVQAVKMHRFISFGAYMIGESRFHSTAFCVHIEYPMVGHAREHGLNRCRLLSRVLPLRTLLAQGLLQVPVQAIRLDTRCAGDGGCDLAPYHPKHFLGDLLVFGSCFHGHRQRLLCVHFRLLLRSHPPDQAFSKEDVGGELISCHRPWLCARARALGLGWEDSESRPRLRAIFAFGLYCGTQGRPALRDSLGPLDPR